MKFAFQTEYYITLVTEMYKLIIHILKSQKHFLSISSFDNFFMKVN
jgi:hypothetical protein